MSTIRVNLNDVTDWNSFHSVFKTAMGFPEFYGRNMNAWTDCMSDLREEDDHAPMSGTVRLKPNEALVLELDGVQAFAERCPEMMKAFVECMESVNRRYSEDGVPTISILNRP